MGSEIATKRVNKKREICQEFQAWVVYSPLDIKWHKLMQQQAGPGFCCQFYYSVYSHLAYHWIWAIRRTEAKVRKHKDFEFPWFLTINGNNPISRSANPEFDEICALVLFCEMMERRERKRRFGRLTYKWRDLFAW